MRFGYLKIYILFKISRSESWSKFIVKWFLGTLVQQFICKTNDQILHLYTESLRN